MYAAPTLDGQLFLEVCRVVVRHSLTWFCSDLASCCIFNNVHYHHLLLKGKNDEGNNPEALISLHNIIIITTCVL